MRALKCKRVARVISLYVAGDLVGEPERVVAAHLASCESCRRLAEEFSESNGLLTQACAPPEFGAKFYSGIRCAVLTEITRDRIRSKPSLFRPRWIYATAFAAIIIVSGVVLQRFVSNRREIPRDLARAPQATRQATSQALEAQSPRKKHELSETQRTLRNEALAFANPHRSSRHFEAVREPDASARAAQDNGKQIAPTLQSSTSVGPVLAKSATLAGSSASAPFERASESQVSRIEIQTADPNIRIIWLSPRESGEPHGTKHDQDHPEANNRK